MQRASAAGFGPSSNMTCNPAASQQLACEVLAECKHGAAIHCAAAGHHAIPCKPQGTRQQQ